jgi:hypothetical protein
MAEATSNMLNYADTKMKASSSKSYRVKIPSSNGTNFSMNQTIDIDLPSNVRNTYLDFSSSYLRFNVTNNNANAIKLCGQGAYCLIKKLECVVGSQTLFSTDNYNQLVDMLLDQDTNSNYKNGAGRVLFGSGSLKFTGFAIAANAVKSVALPLVGNILYNSEKYIPLHSAEKIRLKLTLDTAALGTIGAATDAEIALSDVNFVCYFVEVDEEVQQMIDSSTGGIYSIVGDNYSHASNSMANNASQVTIQTGFSYGSLNRILLSFNPTVSRVADRNSFCRSQSRLLEASVLVNGQKVPARPVQDITVAAGSLGSAEVLAELLIADKALHSFSHASSFGGTSVDAFTLTTADTAGASNATCGTFMVSIDTERVRGDSNKIYSGINTIGSTVQVQAEMTPDANSAASVDAFANYTTKFTLDASPEGSRVWTVQV